ncbi:MAG: gamma-glutamyltransferase [Acidimicrobiia bacterium]
MAAGARPGRAIVAAGHPGTAAAADAVLRSGGNAYDAIVAAGFAAAVCEPGFTSLGGGGFLLAHTAAGEEVVFDFFCDTPGRGLHHAPEPHFHSVDVDFGAAVQAFHIGRGSVAVPGVLPGYLHVHGRLGRLPLTEVVAPAVTLARTGVAVTPLQAWVMELLWPIFTSTDAMRALFAPAGRRLVEGDTFANAELAAFLEDLGAGRVAGLHAGTPARTIATDMADGDGLVTFEDLGAYEVVEREPLECEFRGLRILANPPPSFGGTLVGESLRLLEGRGAPLALGSGAELVRRCEILVEVDRRRTAGVSRGTTHVSVADAEGNVAAMTTSNGEGSGYVVPGTGVILNNMLGEDDLHPDGFHSAAPGERIGSMMSPTLVMDGGRPRLVLGSGGSKRIRTAIFQVIAAIVDGGVDVAAAVAGPRLHWDGAVCQIEPGCRDDAITTLAARYRVNVWPAANLYFGGVHTVDLASGTGAGDSRRGGVVRVV